MRTQDEIKKQRAAISRRYYRKIVAIGGQVYKDYINKVRIRQNKYRRELRKKVILGYGGRCVCCDETRLEFLSIDHTDGGGNKHRKSLGQKAIGSAFYLWIIRNKFPKKFRLLCHNCNLSRGFYGYCPHQNEKPTA